MTTARRPRDAAATRADLLTAAMRLFTVRGYERTTTREIAAAAGVNVALIARYFGSKDGLYAAVLEATASRVDTQGAGNLVQEIVAGLGPDAWPEFGHEHPLLLLLRPDPADARTAQLRRRALDRTVDRLGGRVPAGGPDADRRARLRGAALLAVVAGVAAVHAALADDPFGIDDDAQLRVLLADVVAAIGAPPTGGGQASAS